MDAIRSLTASAARLGRTRGILGVALAAVALGGAGCQSAGKSRAEVLRSLGLGSKPTPPTQFICIVEPNVQYLPDTTRNGQPSAVLLGKVYLFGADQKPVPADGQLTVVMNDTTIRPAGQSPKVPELVHFDAATLKTLRANDERFGPHYVFLIPWRPDWSDVTHVTVQARFSPNKELKIQDLFHPESRFPVNPGTPILFDQKTGQPMNGPNPNIPTAAGVPDPNGALKQFLAGGMPPTGAPGGAVGTPPVQQAGGFTPPMTTPSGNGSRVTSGAWAAPVPPVSVPTAPAMPTILPPGPLPALPGGGVPAWPPATGPVPPPVGPIGELRPDGGLQSVVIPRQ